jgi:RNA polymerase sigma-70 factor (ECF subfamily)
MSAAHDSLEALLERLNRGDDEAATQAFVVYEPYLRMVVRRRLSSRARAKFDSADIVQSVWADLLAGFRSGRWRFDDPAHLQAFLARATCNRFLNRLRHHRRGLEHERPLDEGRPVPASTPTPSQVAQADDAWEKLLALCPPAHRELLVLKRQGLPLADLAARTGLHPSSVRRILYELARQFGGLPKAD